MRCAFALVLLWSLTAIGCSGSDLPQAARTQCVAPEMTAESTLSRRDELQQFVDRSVSAGLPGMVMLVETPEGLWAGAAGLADIERGVPFGRCTPSRIGSVTKTFTATLVLRLVERGLVELDEPAHSYLPRRIMDGLPNARRVTVRQLLNHTSGIPSYTDDLGFGTAFLNEPDREWTVGELLDFVRGDDPLWAPGAKYEYSNTNFVLLGRLAESVTGRSLQELMTEEIFGPAELATAHFDPDNIIPAGAARGYIDLYGGGTITESTNYLIGGYADGGIVATAYDLLRFSRSLFGEVLLARATLDEMTTSVAVPEPEYGLTRYGLGLRYWETDCGGAWGHTGGSWGYLAEMFYFPTQDTTVVVLVNGSLGEINEKFDEQVHQEIPELLFGSGSENAVDH
ncbi:beta-lactamase family protein [Persicimonas caeni]|uniref:Beta-lactamase family protein n=1 Tax=Persicimonas caeni TaxID=2292766 RepID=A0A4Y6Q0P6_PERCE|nr:serine hydrolase domain-containing protein [Persicimonas caeni]QDG54168.1 beta-lactamase family protein [Persicimonas caeni]QED35389.1 beta-lactamase family protein [Persicimonas caeni]